MKNAYLYLMLFFGISTFLSCEKLIKDEYKIIDWTYPSNLPRDPDLIGSWYGLNIRTGEIDDSIVYKSDGKCELYEYDNLNKVFKTKNLWQVENNGKQKMYWSAENGIATLYDLLRGSNPPNEPLISIYSYRLSIIKDSLYYTQIDNIKPRRVRKMPK